MPGDCYINHNDVDICILPESLLANKTISDNRLYQTAKHGNTTVTDAMQKEKNITLYFTSVD